MSEELLDLLDLGERAVADHVALVRELDESDADRPTDLAGWTVRDVVAHTAHLEAATAGAPDDEVEVPEGLSHVRGPMGAYCEQGVIARRGRTLAELADETERSTSQRVTAVRQDPPEDASAPAPGGFGALGWSWRTLLSNRPLDVWMHEQDLRRATDRPGNLDSPAARHVVQVFTRSWGLVVAKRAQARPGQIVGLELTDQLERVLVTVDENGRGVPTTVDAEPDVTVRMGVESYVVLCGGRRPVEEVRDDVAVDGDDPELAERILASMTLTP